MAIRFSDFKSAKYESKVIIHLWFWNDCLLWYMWLYRQIMAILNCQSSPSIINKLWFPVYDIIISFFLIIMRIILNIHNEFLLLLTCKNRRGGLTFSDVPGPPDKLDIRLTGRVCMVYEGAKICFWNICRALRYIFLATAMHI